MFICDCCDKHIKDGCEIYIVEEGVVIDEEDNNLDMAEEKAIYCSHKCLVIDFDI